MATFKDLQLDWSMLCTEDDWTNAGKPMKNYSILTGIKYFNQLFFVHVLAVQMECGFYMII